MIGFGGLAAALLGAGLGLGLVLIANGMIGRDPATAPREPGVIARRIQALRTGASPVKLAAAAGAGITAYLLTGWPSAGLLAAAAAVILPKHLGRDTAAATEQAKIAAVATWTEQLSGTLSAAAGLEQSIVAASGTAPAAIRTPALALAGRIKEGVRTPAALEAFSREVGDETCDLVCTALTSAATGESGNIAELLGQLATTARERVDQRLRTSAERAKVRSQVRTVITVVLVTITGMCLGARSYLAPYASPTGQLILLAVGAIFATGFAWMQKISAPSPARRLFTRTTHPEGP